MKRSAMTMFDRCTEPARLSLFVSRHNAWLDGAPTIEPRHLLRALLRGQCTTVLAVLGRAGISVDRLLALVPTIPPTPPSGADRRREIPFSDEVKRVLPMAMEEADALRHAKIGTGHILLALLRTEEGAAGAPLTEAGGRVESVRDALVQLA